MALARLHKSDLNVAVVGCGFIASTVHLPLLTRFRGVKVTAVCDVEKNKALEISRRFQIPTAYADLELMLKEEKPDLVDICTPPDCHADQLLRCFEMGYSCMVEKPLTTHSRDAGKLVSLAKEKSLDLFVLHTYSYLPCFRKAKSMLAEGRIGNLSTVDIRYLTPLKSERYFGSNHWAHKLPAGILSSEITPHLLMLLLDVLGKIDEARIFANKTTDLSYIAADELRMILRSDPSVGCLSLLYNSPVTVFTLELIGDKGYLFVDGNSESVIYHKAESTSITRRTFSRGLWSLSDIWQRSAGLVATTLNVLLRRYKVVADGHRYLMKECFSALRGESSYPVDNQKACEVVELLEKIYQSVNGQR